MSKKLNAENLKEALWNTLQAVREGTVDPEQADSVASQAREILRTSRTQLQIIKHASARMPDDLLNFATEPGDRKVEDVEG